MGENRNFLLAAVIAIGILFFYQAFILDPMARDREAAEQATAETQVQETGDDAPQAADSGFAAGLGENGMSVKTPSPAPSASRSAPRPCLARCR